MKLLTSSLAAAVLALATGAAQAAHLQLLGASAFGSSQTVVTVADGESLSFNGTVGGQSGLTDVLAFGSATHTGTLASGGLGFSNEWARMASLDASGASTRFSASGSSMLSFDGTAQLGDAVESASVGLSAELRVAADGEAAGTAVQLRLQLSAESLFSSTLAGATDTPTFNLLVQDAAFKTLASYNGLALSSGETLDVSFSSAVGQTLNVMLDFGNALSVGNAALSGLQTVESSALLEGTLTVTAVPEPQSLVLMSLGLLGLGLAGAAGRRGFFAIKE